MNSAFPDKSKDHKSKHYWFRYLLGQGLNNPGWTTIIWHLCRLVYPREISQATMMAGSSRWQSGVIGGNGAWRSRMRTMNPKSNRTCLYRRSDRGPVLGLHLVILHRCYVPFCDHVWTWTGWNSGRTKPRKKGNDMILSYPRSKIATDPNCSFMLIRLFIKMPKRMRTGWVWNSGANCNGRLAVNCQAIAKGSDMRWFVYLCIIFPVKDWHRKKKTLAMNKWIRKTLRYFSCGCFCMNSKSRTTVAMC